MRGRRFLGLFAALSTVSPVVVMAVPASGAAAPQSTEAQEARQTYNNKMALIGVLRESARQRAVADGDLQTLCLILGIGLDVTDRYLSHAQADAALQSRRRLMVSDLETCLKGLQTGSSTKQSSP